MTKYAKYLFYLFVLTAFISVRAGSYEDYFFAVDRMIPAQLNRF
jgi:hypothetical protein